MRTETFELFRKSVYLKVHFNFEDCVLTVKVVEHVFEQLSGSIHFSVEAKNVGTKRITFQAKKLKKNRYERP